MLKNLEFARFALVCELIFVRVSFPLQHKTKRHALLLKRSNDVVGPASFISCILKGRKRKRDASAP